jgi:hypothetical protein
MVVALPVANAVGLSAVAATPPLKFKRNLDPSACGDRFRATLLS